VHVGHISCAVASWVNELIVQLSLLLASSLRNFRHRDEFVKEVVEITQQSSNTNTGLILLYHDVEASFLVPEGRE
jgi:hypothetical protein